MRNLIASVVTGVVALVAGDRVLGWYGQRHFLPERQMQTAVAAGDGCIMFLGDSRIEAALNHAVVHQALSQRGADRCIADLGMGAMDVSGEFLAARRYLASGRNPILAVVGKVEDSLMDPDATGPAKMVGNNAIHLVWTNSRDVFAEVDGFPFASVAAFDDGLRFLIARGTAFGRYQSLVSLRVQRLQDGLTGTDRGLENRFGQLSDMAALERDLREHADARLAAATDKPGVRSSWFDRLVDMLHSRGTRVAVVEIPMPSAYRQSISASVQAGAYRRWFTDHLRTRGVVYIDLALAPWVDDDSSMFVDPLHLSPAGAAHFSRDLGDRLPTVVP
jgi:hypothetical protein